VSSDRAHPAPSLRSESRSPIERRLIYVGLVPGAAVENEGRLLFENEVLRDGSVLRLERRRSYWPASREVERLIVGADPKRCDLLLSGPGIGPEHVRFYLSRSSADVNDLKPIHEGTVAVNGQILGHDWWELRPGDIIDLLHWRFRWEIKETR